jgi:hypothetical protein
MRWSGGACLSFPLETHWEARLNERQSGNIVAINAFNASGPISNLSTSFGVMESKLTYVSVMYKW